MPASVLAGSGELAKGFEPRAPFRPRASGVLSASLQRTMRHRSRQRITRLSVFRLLLLAACGDTTIVVIGDQSGIKAGVVEREGPEVKVSGRKLDHSSVFFGGRLPKLRY
jgi:hypothetical protein